MPYQPIENYGLIGNLRTAALVGMDGSIDWLCLPRFDSPSVFAAILDDQKGGRFRIAPPGEGFRHKQHYWPNTNILITRFLHPDGIGEVEDYMPVGGAGGTRRTSSSAASGSCTAACRSAWSAGPPSTTPAPGTTHPSPGNGARFDGPGLSLGLAASVPLRRDGDGVLADFTLGEGQSATFILRQLDPGNDAGHCPGTGEAEERFRETVAYWQRWLSHCTYQGRWREMVQRSALALKLLTYEPTGALVAAPTTSLPEDIGGVRNWDYRYTWLRDASFTLYALMRIGFTEEAARFMDWLAARWHEDKSAGDGPLQLMYGIDGRAELAEEELPHLEGYRGSRPVRIGNAAHGQLQLDIYGELMDSAYLFNKYGTPARLRRLAGPPPAGGLGLRQLGARGRGDLGGARRAAALRLLAADVLGGPGPRPAAGRQAVVPGRPGAVAAACATRSTRR